MSGRELPAGWVEAELGDVADIKSGITLGKKRPPNQELIERPYLRVANVQRGSLDLSVIKTVTVTPEEAEALKLEEGDILMNEGGDRDKLGRGWIWTGEIPNCIHQNHVFRVRLRDRRIQSKYVSLYANEIGRHFFEKQGKQSVNLASINQTMVAKLPVPLPPLPEQRRIVEKIEALTARSRRAREALDALPALIDRYRQSILAAAFRGDLTAEWRKQHQRTDAEATRTALLGERQRVWAERRRRRYSPPVPLEFEDLAPLPKQWFWSTADECTWELTVGHVGPMKDRYVASGVPFLRSQNVRENRFDPKELRFIPEEFHRELGKSVLRPGDVVVVRSGAPGVACAVPDELSEVNCADVVICRFLPSFKPRLLSYYINSMSARRMIFGMQVGVAQQHFNVGAMARLPVPVIPIDEQEVLLSLLDRAFHRIAEMEKRVLAQEDRLSTLDQSICAKAFRGELVPQDPSDEPASVLLERIRAERAAAGVAPRRGRRARAE